MVFICLIFPLIIGTTLAPINKTITVKTDPNDKFTEKQIIAEDPYEAYLIIMNGDQSSPNYKSSGNNPPSYSDDGWWNLYTYMYDDGSDRKNK